MKKEGENKTKNDPKCERCQDTGWYYNEGHYGWDYGSMFTCECPVGVAENEEYHRLMGYERKESP